MIVMVECSLCPSFPLKFYPVQFVLVESMLRLWKSRVLEIPEAEQSYTEACQKDFLDHGNATVEGQDLASTYVLCPRPRTGCPDFRMGWKDVMGQSMMEQGVMEQRAES